MERRRRSCHLVGEKAAEKGVKEKREASGKDFVGESDCGGREDAIPDYFILITGTRFCASLRTAKPR